MAQEKNLKSLFGLWLPVVGWAGFIFYLSSLQSAPSGNPFFDLVLPVVAHLVEYSVLFLFLWRATKNPAFSFVLGLLYALSDEFHQAFVPTRVPSLGDVAADLLAMVLVWGLVAKLPLKWKKIFR